MSSTLEDHEKLCEQRYAEVERRLGNVEDKLEDMRTEMGENFRRNTNLVLTCFGLILSTIGVVGTIIGFNL
jgi:hypothetical protein